MAEYIDRDALFDNIKFKYWDVFPTGSEVISIMMKYPAANVRENVTGTWCRRRTWDHDGEIYCPFCNYEPLYDMETNFCPNCGAIMVDLKGS